MEEYQGLSIPPLPDAVTSLTSIVKHDEAFLRERKSNLNNFLRLITAHPKIRLDELLCKFLTQQDFEDGAIDPYLYGKLKRMMQHLPNTHGLRLDLDFVNTFLTFKMTGTDAEDDCLKPVQVVVEGENKRNEFISFALKKTQVLDSLATMKAVLKSMQE